MNLLCQLARGRDDERPGVAARAREQFMEYRQHECRRLACSGLRRADKVLSGKYRRDGRYLNRRGGGVAREGDARLQAWVEVELVETQGKSFS